MSKQKNQMNAPDREQGSRINKDTAKRLHICLLLQYSHINKGFLCSLNNN